MVKALKTLTALVAGTTTAGVIQPPNNHVGHQVAPAASSARHRDPNLAGVASANADGAQGYTGRGPLNAGSSVFHTLVPRKKGGGGGGGGGSDDSPCISGTYYTVNGKERCLTQGGAAGVSIIGTFLVICAVCSASKSVRKKTKAAFTCCGQPMRPRDNAGNSGGRSHGLGNNIPLPQRGFSSGNRPQAQGNRYQTGNATQGQPYAHANWYNHPNSTNASSNSTPGS